MTSMCSCGCGKEFIKTQPRQIYAADCADRILRARRAKASHDRYVRLCASGKKPSHKKKVRNELESSGKHCPLCYGLAHRRSEKGCPVCRAPFGDNA